MPLEALKWCEIAQQPSERRFGLLSQTLNLLGLQNEFRAISLKNDTNDPTALKNAIGEAQKDCGQIRIGRPYGMQTLTSVSKVEQAILQIGACDSLVKEAKDWWPRSFLYEAFVTLFAELPQLDLTARALVVGSGSTARVAACALAKIGFRRINVADQSESRPEKMIEHLRKFNFNVSIDYVPDSRLIYLPGVFSCVINTSPLVEGDKLINELYYFNFLSSLGAVFDMNLTGIETSLLKAAKDAGAHTISGSKIAAATDYHWSRMLGVEIDREKYETEMNQALAQ